MKKIKFYNNKREIVEVEVYREKHYKNFLQIYYPYDLGNGYITTTYSNIKYEDIIEEREYNE